MPFALIGYFLAIHPEDSVFSWKLFVLVVLCMIFARNAAMSFNRVTDRFIDKRNPRTASREIPAGVIHPRNAFIFTVINAILFILTTYLINKLVFYLSPVALFIVLIYSYTKRFTILCHFVLGLGLGLAPIGAYLAVTGEWNYIPLIFSLIIFLWVAGFDILYSIQDEQFDKEESLKSLPAIYGRVKAQIVSAMLHAIVTFLVVKIGVVLNSGTLYWIGAVAFIALLVIHHLIVISTKDEKKFNVAFATLNGTSSIVYAFFTILSFYY